MPNNIDQRIVQMRFDNAQFERNVKTTRQSLKKLKEDLNFDDNVKNISNLQQATKKFDASGMAGSIQNISDKFTAMGAIGFTVIQNLTNSVLSFGKKIASSTIGQIFSGGRTRALNLEQAQFQIKGLGLEWKKATKYGESLYDQIDTAVKGTAYGLDAAAKVAGQLLASNIEAGSKDMQNALSGISGVAAMTNSTYEDIGHIFTTIAGNGRIMGEQLNQFAGRGLNVAAKLAEYYKVDEKTLREMVSKGEVDFKTFAKVMNESFGKQATKANETYTGSLSNVKAALSRIGAEIQTPYLENMRQTFVALIPVLNGVKSALGPMFDLTSKGMSFVKDEIVGFLSSLASLDKENKLQVKGLQSFSNAIKDFSDRLYKADLYGKTAIDYLKSSYKSIKSVFGYLKDVTGTVLDPIRKTVKETLFGNAPSILTSVFRSLSNGLRSAVKYLASFSLAVSRAVNGDRAFSNVIRALVSGLHILWSVLKLVAKGMGSLLKASIPVSHFIMRLVEPFAKLIWIIDEFFFKSGEAKRKLAPFTAAFHTLSGTVKNIVGIFKEAMSKALNPFGKKLDDSSDKYNKFSKIVGGALEKFAKTARSVLNQVNEWLNEHQKEIQKAGTVAGTIIRNVINFFKNFGIKVGSVFSSFKNGLSGVKDSVSKTVESFGKIKMDGVSKFSERFKASTGPLQAIGRFFSSFFKLIKTVISKVGPLIKSLTTLIFDGLSSAITIITDGLNRLNIGGNASGLLAAGGIIGGFIVFLKRLSQINPTKFGRSITALFDTISIKLRELRKQKIAWTLKQFAGAILELAIAMVMLSSIQPDRLVFSLGVISALMQELKNVMLTLNNATKTISLTKRSTADSLGSMLLKMATAILLLSFAMETLSGLDSDKLMSGMVAISALLWELVAVSKVMSSSEKQMVNGTNGLIMMAIAVRILVASVQQLSILSWEDLGKGLLGTISLIFALAGAVKLISKSKGIFSAALGMVLIGTALRIIVPVVKQFGEMKWEQLGKAGVALAGLLTALSLFSRFSKGSTLMSSGIGMIFIAMSLVIFSKSIKAFGDMDWSQIGKAATVISGLIVILTLFSRFAKGGKLIVLSVGMNLIASSLIIFSKSIKAFGDMDWSQIGKAATVIGGLITILTIFSRAAKSLNLLVLSASLIVFSTAMLEFSLVMKALGSMSWENVIKGLVVIAATLTILGIAAKKLGPMIGTIMALSGAMTLFGLGATLLGVGLILISAGIGALSGSLAALGKLVQFLLITILESIPMVLEIVGKIIVGVLNIIAESAPAIGNALVAVVGAALDSIIELAPKIGETFIVLLDTFLPVLEKYTPKFVDHVLVILIGVIEALKKRIPELVFAIAGVLKSLIGAIAEVARREFNVNSLKEVVLGFAAVAACFVAIAVAAKIAKNAKDGMLMIIGIMGLITVMFLILSTIDTETFKNLAIGISEAMLAISTSMFIISLVPVAGAAEGIAGFAIVVGGLVAILEILGGLNQIPGFMWLLEEGTKVLAQLGQAIGEFVGNIIGGLLDGVISNLPAIADSLSEFMIHLQPFLDGAKQINADMMEGVLKLCEVILLLTAADLIDGIMRFFGGGIDFAKFGKELVAFAEYLKPFADTVGQLTDDNIKAIENAAGASKALAEFAKEIPNSGGLLGKLVGDNDIDKWAPQLPKLGTALVEFSGSVSTLEKKNIDAMYAAADAATALAKFAKEIPNSGGLLGDIVGNNDIDQWAPQLPKFGTALVEFSGSVSKLKKKNIDSINAAADAGTALARLSENLPNSGGLVAFFAGENKLSEWAPQLEDFGKYMKRLSDELGDSINTKTINSVVEAAGGLVTLSKETPRKGGLSSWFGGDNVSLSDIGEQIYYFGSYMCDIIDEIPDGASSISSFVILMSGITDALSAIADIKDVNASLVTGDTRMSNIGEQLYYLGSYVCDILKELPSSRGSEEIVKLFGSVSGIITNIAQLNGVDLSNFKIDSLGETFVAFFNSISTLDADKIQNRVKACKIIIDFVKSIPSNLGDGFTKTLQDLSKIDYDALVRTAGDVENIKNGGKAFLRYFVAGVDGYKGTASLSIKLVFAYLVSQSIEKLEGTYSEFHKVGQAFVMKIASGMKDTSESLVSSVRTISSKALSSVDDYKTEFYNTGTYFVKGIAKGITDQEYEALNAASNMAKKVISETNKTLGIHSPSKEGVRSGRFWDIGFANGIMTYSSVVNKATKNLSENVVDTTFGIMDSMSKIDFDNIEFNPMIRPVMDASNVYRGIGSINSLMSGSKTYTISASAVDDRAAIMDDNKTIKVEAKNSDVVDEVRDLKSEIKELKSAIAGMRLYLDGNSLVGGIIDDVDDRLGRRAYRSKKVGQ